MYMCVYTCVMCACTWLDIILCNFCYLFVFFVISQSEADQVFEGVKTAISCGYTHIDCARVYGNEDQVGDALKAKMDDGTVTRDQLFITSKVQTKSRKTPIQMKLIRNMYSYIIIHRFFYVWVNMYIIINMLFYMWSKLVYNNK